MTDWKRGMQRIFEFYRVNPETWGDAERLETVTGADITRDADLETLGSASFSMDAFDGEMYVRTYLVTIQDGVREAWPLGTHLLISDGRDFDGMRSSRTVGGYTPLKELLDDMPPLGFTLPAGTGMARIESLMRLHARMPVGESDMLYSSDEPYTADPDADSWLSFLSGWLAKAGCCIDVDERGNGVIAPIQDSRALAPCFTFDDGNSSILQPAVTVDSNMPDVPNVVEVVSSGADGTLSCELADDSEDSPTSTKGRGRTVRHRESSPDLPDNPTQSDVDDAARRLLRKLTATQYEIRFTHAYVPGLRPGMAVRLAYSRMGMDVSAVIASQTIHCTPACQVECTARFSIGGAK